MPSRKALARVLLHLLLLHVLLCCLLGGNFASALEIESGAHHHQDTVANSETQLGSAASSLNSQAANVEADVDSTNKHGTVIKSKLTEESLQHVKSEIGIKGLKPPCYQPVHGRFAARISIITTTNHNS